MTDIKPGDRVQVGGYVCTVEAVSGPDQVVCLRYPDGSLGLERESVPTLIPPKIAEPPIGSVVWDGDVPWVRLYESEEYDRVWVSYKEADRHWSDFSDTVVLAVRPGGE